MNAMNHRRLSGIKTTRLAVIDDSPDRLQATLETLRSRGFDDIESYPDLPSNRGFDDRPPHVLILSQSTLQLMHDQSHVTRRVDRLGCAVIALLDNSTDPLTFLEPFENVSDWLSEGSLVKELPARIKRALAKEKNSSSLFTPTEGGVSVGGQFLALLVHDIRNPLNVVKLSMRLVNQSCPPDDASLAEDFSIIDASLKQIERMLSQLSDYMKLYEGDYLQPPVEFSPSRLIDDLLDERATRLGPKAARVIFESDATTPLEASLDQKLASLALYYLLENATAVATSGSIRLKATGGPDRWVTQVTIDQPPHESLRSCKLTARTFDRLSSTDRDRRGLDLAIAARVSEIFGGTARLDVIPDRKTTLVLDWPARQGPSQ